MNKLNKAILLAVATVLLVGTVCYAATYEFKFPTYVTDTSGVARTYYPAMLEYGGQDLVDSGKINADALDTNMQIASSSIKYMVAQSQVNAVIPTLPASGKQTLDLYTGYVPNQTVFPVVSGENGFITVPDDGSLELGNRFEIEIDGYIDTSNGVGGDIVYKEDAIDIGTSGTDDINVDMTWSVASSETLAPNGAGSETNINTLFGAATHWQACLTDDGDTSYVAQTTGAFMRDLYACTNTGIGAGIITSVEIHVVVKETGINAEFATAVKTNGVVHEGAETELPAGYTDYDTTYFDNPETTVPWTWADIDAMEIGLKIRGDIGGGSHGRCTRVYAVVNFDPVISLSISPVLSAEMNLRVYSDTAWLMLSKDSDTSWDGVNSDRIATGGAGVAPNGNDWYLMDNHVASDFTPYWNYYKHSVGGALVTYYEPDTMILTTTEAGTADAGTAVSLDDAILNQGDDYWNGARLHIITTTDGFAPQGETSVVTDFDSANDRLTFDALTAVVDAGDTYTIDFGTLPDREVAGNDARITWGYNSNITIQYGEMSGSGSTTASVAADGGFDMPEVSLPTGWFASGGNVANLPFYDMVLSVSTETGQPVQSIYFLMIIAFALGVFLLLAIFTRMALLGVIGFNLVLVVGASMTVVPLWIPFATVIAQVAIMYVYSQTAR